MDNVRLTNMDDARLQWVDRLDKILDTVTKLGVAYAGMKAIDHVMGGVVGLVALKLATSPSVAAGAVGSATLAGIGLLNYVPTTDGGAGGAGVTQAPVVTDVSKDYPFMSWLPFLTLSGRVIEEESWISPDPSLLPQTHGQPPITRLPK